MDEQRKHAILFSATILAARKLAEIGGRPCPAREMCMEDAISNAERIVQKIDERWPATSAYSSLTNRARTGHQTKSVQYQDWPFWLFCSSVIELSAL